MNDPRRAEYLSDILITALEGGIAYWAIAKELNEQGDQCLSVKLKADEQYEGPAFPDGDPRNDWTLVDHAKIDAAIQKIINTDGICGKYIRKAIAGSYITLDAGDIDADYADVIVQIAAFDEIVFS